MMIGKALCWAGLHDMRWCAEEDGTWRGPAGPSRCRRPGCTEYKPGIVWPAAPARKGTNPPPPKGQTPPKPPPFPPPPAARVVCDACGPLLDGRHHALGCHLARWLTPL